MPAAISDEIRARVVADLLATMSVSAAARKYKLGKATVSRLKNEISSERLEQVGTEKRSRIDDLLVECIETNLGALNRIARASSESDYIRRQPAGDIARLYEGISDTTLRLLEAASAAGLGDEAEDAAQPADAGGAPSNAGELPGVCAEDDSAGVER